MRIINLPSGSTVYTDDAIAIDRDGTGSRKFALFSWLSSHYRSKSALIEIEDGGWYEVTGKLEVRFSKAYNKRGPVLNVEKAEKADAPEQPVATFY